VLAMPFYRIAIICFFVMLVPIAAIQEMMRRQVNDAKYGIGSPDLSPWDVRFVNEMFGKHGIWKAHKQAYERSVTRAAFIVFSAAMLISAVVALVAFLVGTR
jgi:hypothetical protein